MSVGLWDKLPPGFLKIGFKRWRKLNHGVRRLVAELAESQNFKCALCSATRGLVIEHDMENAGVWRMSTPASPAVATNPIPMSTGAG